MVTCEIISKLFQNNFISHVTTVLPSDTCAHRDSEGASPNASDTSDSKDDRRNLRRKRDVTGLAMTSQPTATGPQGVVSTSEKVAPSGDKHGTVTMSYTLLS